MISNCLARCLSCGSEGCRGFFEKVDLGVEAGGVYDKCPSCGSVDVDVLSPTGIEVEARIAAVAAASL